MSVHTHRESPDPRNAGYCACGHRLEPQPTRNREYERQFLENVEREALRRFGVNVVGYKLSVERRLEIGAERYGDTDFLSKDLIRELLEETPDVAAYAVLQSEKETATEYEDVGAVHHLFEAAVFAALADWHARQARTA